MMRLLTILICVFFLSGFGWFSSIDCEDAVDSALYNEGVSHLNEREKKMRRMIYRANKSNAKAVERYREDPSWLSIRTKRKYRADYIEICEKYKDGENFK